MTALVKYFHPKPLPHAIQVDNYGSAMASENGEQASAESAQPQPGKKPKPTRAQLGQEIKFDLMLARCSLMMDVISHSLVSALPSPPRPWSGIVGDENGSKRSQAMFVVATSLSGLGSGTLPAIHSLALCMVQVRTLDAKAAGQSEMDEQTGALFGALAVLQAVGQTILGVSLKPEMKRNGP